MGNKLYNLDMTVETSEVQNTENGDNDGEDGDDGKDDPAMEDEDPLDPEEPNFGAGGSTARNGTPPKPGCFFFKTQVATTPARAKQNLCKLK